MSNLQVTNPYQFFTNKQGKELESGKIYIGTPYQSAKANPKSVYWDQALTQPAAQPIRTVGGYPARNGTATRMWVGGDYSIIVDDKNDNLVFSSLSATDGGGKSFTYVDTVTDLKALSLSTLSSNELIIVAGYYAVGDGGGGEFYWDSTSAATDNGGTIIQLNTGGTGRFKRLYSGDLNVKWFGAYPDDTTDNLAILQAVHDALPATGGGIFFPLGTYLITGYNRYVTVTKDNIRMTFEANAILSSENSTDITTTTDPHYVGLTVTGNNFLLIGASFRGGTIGLILSEGDTATFINCYHYNLHNAAVSCIGNYKHLKFIGCKYEISLASTTSNFSAVQAGDDAGSLYRELVSFEGCTFTSLAGGINIHGLQQLSITDCKFKGNNYYDFKSSSSTVTVLQNITVSGSSFDGLAVNAGSANRHISAKGDGTAASGSSYTAFIEKFDNVSITGNNFKNFLVFGIDFVGSDIEQANILISGNTFNGVIKAISRPCGNFTISDNSFVDCGTDCITTSTGTYIRKGDIFNNMFDESSMEISNFGYTLKEKTLVYIQDNYFIYSNDNNGVVRTVIGTHTYYATIYIERNMVVLTGVTVAFAIPSTTTNVRLGFNPIRLSTGSETKPTNGVINYEYKLLDATASGSTTLNGYYIDMYQPIVYRVTNSNSTGSLTYTVADTDFDVNAEIFVESTHASNQLIFVISSGGTIDGGALLRSQAQYSHGVLKKISTGVWVFLARNGTWVYA